MTVDSRELQLTWRTWSKAVAFGLFFLACGLAAVAPGGSVWLRLFGLTMFGVGLYWVLDVAFVTRRWSSTPSRVEIPTLLRRSRSVDLTGGASVRFRKARNSTIVVSERDGERQLLLNPIVSDRDVQPFLDGDAVDR